METKNGTDVGKRAEAAAAEHTRSDRHYTPAVDIAETPENLMVTMDLPGVDRENVDVSLLKGVLTVLGHTRPGRLDKDKGFRAVYAEYEPGHYQRSFQLHEEIDATKIAATMSDGVLRLVLPRSPAARTRRIEVT